MDTTERGLLAVSVLTAAEETPDFGKDLISEIVAEHQGGELIFGMTEASWQLLRWLSETTGVSTREILGRLSESFVASDG